MASLRKSASDSLRSLYQQQNGHGDKWGIEGYHIVHKYEDPIRMKLQRESQLHKKPLSPNKHPTKKGHYLQDEIKRSLSPGPCAYSSVRQWANDKLKTKAAYADRKTYVDDIFHREKNNKYPSPNAYDVTETEEHLQARLAKLKEKKAKNSDNRNFLDTIQYDSAMLPGPGMYAPKYDIVERRFNSSVCLKKETESKDKDKSASAKLKSPDVGTYKPILLGTFDARQNLPNKFHQNKNSWGKEPRFDFLENNKSKSKKQNKAEKLIVPGPGQYNVLNEWKHAKQPMKKRSLFNMVSTGILKSVYY